MPATLKSQAAELNIEIEQGSTFNPIMTYSDAQSNPIDLTGYTARMQIRESIDATSVLYEMTTENGGIVLGDDLGTIELLIPATDSSAFDWTKAKYDFELVTADNKPTRLLFGEAIVLPEVTR